MKIDSSIIKSYLQEKPSAEYSNHWIYSEVEYGHTIFSEPDISRLSEVEHCLKKTNEVCNNFIFRNNDLIHDLFSNASSVITQSNVLLVVGVPTMYDAMVREHDGVFYIVFNLISYADYVKSGHDLNEIITNFLTHELVHLMIYQKYPVEEFNYIEYLDYISFHEGFAHLLSYKDNIVHYQLVDAYKVRFDIAQKKLIVAINETDTTLRNKYKSEINTGSYWDKIGAISSMLFLMKHIESLNKIYEQGWRGYTKLISNYTWV